MRRLLVALSTALVLIGGTAFATPTAVADVPAVVLDSLTVPVGAQPGQAVRASARVHSTSGDIAVQAITIAVRSSTGAAVDFPGAVAATIPPTGYTFTSGTRAFSAGTYEAFVAVQINGVWTNLTPRQTFTVAAAAPAVVLDSLTVPVGAQPGQAVRASARVHSTSGDIAVQAITIAVRSSTGAAVDFPGAVAATIPPTGYTFTSGTRAFSAGTYEAFVAVQINGVWTNLTPRQTFTVAVSNPVTFSQNFNGPVGSSANYDRAGTWFNDPCWANNPACTGSLAQYKEDHARLDGQGSLVLTADRNPDAGAMCQPVRCDYATARLTMLNWAGNGGRPSWSQAGGHFEARIKAPAGRGLWPAFWLIGDQVNGSWPGTGEIDIMEARGHERRTVEQHAHGGPNEQEHMDWGGGYLMPSGDITGWHTYAIDWDASATGYIKWSVDGVVTRTLTAAEAGAKWASFRGPEAIILDLAVGGGDGWIGSPDAATVFPAKMYVDYITVTQNPNK